MRQRGHESPERFHEYFQGVLEHALGFATLVDGRPLGATSYLNVRPDDRVLEIGHTWLNP